MQSRNYNSATIKALFARSGNVCAVPGCHEVLVLDGDYGQPYSFGDIAHIEDLNPSTSRARDWDIAEDPSNRNNLILLCPNHHRKADRNSIEYPVEKLRQLRDAHERAVLEAVLEAKRRTDPALVKTLAESVTFTFSVPSDYKRLSLLIARDHLVEVLRENSRYGVDDNRHLYDLNHTVARYLNCVDERNTARVFFDECIRMYPKLFSESSPEGRDQKIMLLHERQGNDDHHQGEVAFCTSELGPDDERTLRARICMCCVLIASGHLGQASDQLNEIERAATGKAEFSLETQAYINMQRGKILFRKAACLAGPESTKIAGDAVECLRAADRYFTASNSDHVTAKITRFFLAKALRAAGQDKEAGKIWEQVRNYLMFAPHGAMCHYSTNELRSELKCA